MPNPPTGVAPPPATGVSSQRLQEGGVKHVMIHTQACTHAHTSCLQLPPLPSTLESPTTNPIGCRRRPQQQAFHPTSPSL